jgi:hypothetical protein
MHGRTVLVTALLLALSLTSCAQLGLGGQPTQGPPPAGTPAEKSEVYYDFDDIAIPAGFALTADRSYVTQSGSSKSGLLTFDGMVEPVSTANFMVASMARNNWRLKSRFGYGRTFLLFEKPGKTALVSIIDSRTNTRLEVWVAPTADAAPALSPAATTPAPMLTPVPDQPPVVDPYLLEQ